MSDQEYLEMQKRTYAALASTREGAELAVHPRYGEARREAMSTLAYILNDFADRRVETLAGDRLESVRNCFRKLPSTFTVLDFGCGVGRFMEVLAREGYAVHGVDISPPMIDFAQKNEILQKSGSKFFISNGDDCGKAPNDSFDLVYSVLCFQHICVRAIRNKILSSISEVLKPDGVVNIQFQFYPSITAQQIPENHSAWDENKTAAAGTNSQADVWVTTDKLPLVLADFLAFFHDVRLQFVEIPGGTFVDRESKTGVFHHLFVSGCKSRSLCSRIYQRI